MTLKEEDVSPKRDTILLYQMDLQTRGLSQKFFEQHGGRALAFMVAAQLIFTVSHLFTTIDSVSGKRFS